MSDISGVTVAIAETKDLSGSSVQPGQLVIRNPKAAEPTAEPAAVPTVEVVNETSKYSLFCCFSLFCAKDTAKKTATKIEKDIETTGVAKELRDTALDVAKDVGVAIVAKDTTAATAALAKGVSAATTVVTNNLSEAFNSDLSGVLTTVMTDLSGDSVTVNDVILVLPRLIVAAKLAGAADNSALVKLKHSARDLLSQCVKGEHAAAATVFADTYLHAVCVALLDAAPSPAISAVEAVVEAVEEKVKKAGRSCFSCVSR